MKIYTIGFPQKKAETFFNLLINNYVETLIDIRLNNKSQLAGFTKESDLKYFLKNLCNINYFYADILAPTQNILNDYKQKKITWEDYYKLYNNLLDNRDLFGIIEIIKQYNSICLLCSEPTYEHCHRSICAEYIKNNYFSESSIIHI